MRIGVGISGLGFRGQNFEFGVWGLGPVRINTSLLPFGHVLSELKLVVGQLLDLPRIVGSSIRLIGPIRPICTR